MAHKTGITYTHSFKGYFNVLWNGTTSYRDFDVLNCNLTSGSSTITCDPIDGTTSTSTSRIRPGNWVTGSGIPAKSMVLTVSGTAWDSSGLEVSSFVIGNVSGSEVNATEDGTDVTLEMSVDRMYYSENPVNDTPYEFTEYVNHSFPPTGYAYTGSYTGPGPGTGAYTSMYNWEGIRSVSYFVAPTACRPISISYYLNTFAFPSTGLTEESKLRIGLMRPDFVFGDYGQYAGDESMMPTWKTIADIVINAGLNPPNDMNFRKTIHFAADEVGTLAAGQSCGLVFSATADNINLTRGVFTLEFVSI